MKGFFFGDRTTVKIFIMTIWEYTIESMLCVLFDIFDWNELKIIKTLLEIDDLAKTATVQNLSDFIKD